MKFFLDSYAIIEMIDGNLNYAKYVGSDSATSIFNLYELAYKWIKIDEKLAIKYFNDFLNYKVDIADEWIVDAARFRYKHISDNLSYVDALGYIIALKTGRLFLTGDNAFKNMPNVEFVK